MEVKSGDLADQKTITFADYQASVVAAQQQKQAEIAAARQSKLAEIKAQQEEIAREQQQAENEAANQDQASNQDTSNQDSGADLAALDAVTTLLGGVASINAQQKVQQQQNALLRQQQAQQAAVERQQQFAQRNAEWQERKRELERQQLALEQQQKAQQLALAQQQQALGEGRAERNDSVSTPVQGCLSITGPIWNTGEPITNSCGHQVGLSYCVTSPSGGGEFSCNAQSFGSGTIGAGKTGEISVMSAGTEGVVAHFVECEAKSGEPYPIPSHPRWVNGSTQGACP